MANVNLSGKTAIVTGGYSGIGLETTRALAKAGARVIVPVRNPAKAQETLAGMPGMVTTAPMDLGDISSVRRFARDQVAALDKLDLLINNAGVMACPLARVGPGWESQFAINHLGHFALTQGLWPLLRTTHGARLVALSSTAHKLSSIRWDDLDFTGEDYDKWRAYGQAKTANALFANGASRRLAPTGGAAFSVHPGGILTPLQRHLPKEEMMALGWIGEDGALSERARGMFKTPDQGATTTLWAATAPALMGQAGVYCEDCDIAAPTDPESPLSRYSGVDAHACDDDAAERLWQASADLLDAA
ncbi:MAG: oxidoreductase [Pseudomonadota bacterium]